jgi:translation initiation factor 3 subunit I
MKPLVLFGHTRPVSQVQFSEDGSLLFTSGRDSNMNVFDGETGELIGTFDGHKGALSGFDAHSEWLATASADGYLRIFSILDGQLICELKMDAPVRAVSFSSDGTKLVVCNDKFTARIPAAVTVYPVQKNGMILENSELLKIDEALPMRANMAKFTNFDSQIVTIHEDGFVFIWDSSTGEKIKEFEAHSRAISKIQFSPDRKFAVTSSVEGRAKVWETSEWSLVKEIESDRPLNDAQISPVYRGGKLVREHLIVGGGQEARNVTTTAAQEGKFETVLFNFVQEIELGKIKGHFGPVHTLAWHPDGLGFATGSEDGFVRLHRMDSDYYVSKKWE